MLLNSVIGVTVVPGVLHYLANQRASLLASPAPLVVTDLAPQVSERCFYVVGRVNTAAALRQSKYRSRRRSPLLILSSHTQVSISPGPVACWSEHLFPHVRDMTDALVLSLHVSLAVSASTSCVAHLGRGWWTGGCVACMRSPCCISNLPFHSLANNSIAQSSTPISRQLQGSGVCFPTRRRHGKHIGNFVLIGRVDVCMRADRCSSLRRQIIPGAARSLYLAGRPATNQSSWVSFVSVCLVVAFASHLSKKRIIRAR